jgi:hypothetical protein
MTMDTQHTAESALPVATSGELGIGMRFSLHPHCDDFVDVILGALAEVADAGLTDRLVIETDDVSTYVGTTEDPAEERLVRYLAAVIPAAARRTRTGHVVAHVLLSRGCPGEATCDLSVTGLPAPAPVDVPATGVPAVAQWSLYPLLDGGSSGGSHMRHIENAIERAQQRGTAARAAHYATRLSGDLADVLATAADAWAAVGSEVTHVVCHLTISVGSPSSTT